MRFFWGCHSWFLRYVWFIFQYWYFIMETSSIHNLLFLLKRWLVISLLNKFFAHVVHSLNDVFPRCRTSKRLTWPIVVETQAVVVHPTVAVSRPFPLHSCLHSQYLASFSPLLIRWSRNRRVSNWLETVVNVDYDIDVDIVVLLLLM